METFEQFVARTGLPYNDTGWVAYVASGQTGAGQQDVADAQRRQAQGLSTGGGYGATAETGANPGYATDTYGGGPGSNTVTLTPQQAAVANAMYQRPNYGAWPGGYFGGRGGYGMPYPQSGGQDTGYISQGPMTVDPRTGVASHAGGGQYRAMPMYQPAQGMGGRNYDWASQMGGQFTNQNRQMQTQPQQQRAPAPWQVNPARYNEMSTVGRGLLQGLAGQSGYDWGDYQERMQAAAPQGRPIGNVSMGFQRPRGVYGGF